MRRAKQLAVVLGFGAGIAGGAGCPHKPPPVPIVEPATRTVESGRDLVGAEGVRATVVGRLERRHPAGIPAEGTAIVLPDGTEIYVSEAGPPPGWEWMLDTQVRVQGLLWEKAPTGWPVAKLEQAEPPLPADVSILLAPK